MMLLIHCGTADIGRVYLKEKGGTDAKENGHRWQGEEMNRREKLATEGLAHRWKHD